ncbi:hypothetical protein M501DRAFT_1014452 [Patellaria atrata CBS 101060]|uniref:Uncharacterized protein n=1 Tax=Patellaria atrata CBS 101060 TaxID=1346257 RepID=A0A9P4VU66_9PEZI|nr:hypothetical protein M501DRAFT_1014452 [Patellaria atrata CBS 101060]
MTQSTCGLSTVGRIGPGPSSAGTVDSPAAHPYLGFNLEDLQKNFAERPSFVAFGEGSGIAAGSFFIRTTDRQENWHYRWAGLLYKCAMVIQRHIVGGKEDIYGATEWVGRRISVALGYGISWVIYGSDWFKYEKGKLPGKLERALADAKARPESEKFTINPIALNIKNKLEYVLVFNNGTVYYSFHKEFLEDFEKVARQWTERKAVDFTAYWDPLSTTKCQHTRSEETTCRNSQNSFQLPSRHVQMLSQPPAPAPDPPQDPRMAQPMQTPLQYGAQPMYSAMPYDQQSPPQQVFVAYQAPPSQRYVQYSNARLVSTFADMTAGTARGRTGGSGGRSKRFWNTERER